MKISKDINKDIVSLNIYLLGVLCHSRDMIKDMVSLGLSMQMLLLLNRLLRMVIRMVMVTMQEVKKELLKVYFDINFDIMTKLMDILMVKVSMIKIELVLKMIQQMKLKCFYQDNNQDILSRLSETRAGIQVFCPRFNYMGISCPRSFNLFFFNNLIKTQI